MRSNVSYCLLWCSLWCNSNSFTAPITSCHRLPAVHALPLPKADLPVSSTFHVGAVETFDGSSIVEPMVVSNVFFHSLQAKFVSILIGQLLAMLFFGLIVTFASRQLSTATTWMGDQFAGRRQQAAARLRMPPTLSDARSDTTKSPNIGKLVICVIIDLLGSSSELLPVVGELSDIVYAPLAAYALRALFGGSNVVFALEFVEEILPFTDILPLATICWWIETFAPSSDAARLLGIGQHHDGGQVIGVDKKQLDDNDW